MIPDLARLELCTSIRQALDQIDFNTGTPGNRKPQPPQPFCAVLVYPPGDQSCSIGVTCLQINRNKCNHNPVCTLSKKGECKPEVAVIIKGQYEETEQILVSELHGYTFTSLAPLMPTARIIAAAECVCGSDTDCFASKLLQRTNDYTPIPGDDPTTKVDLHPNWQRLNSSQTKTVCHFVDMQSGCMVVEGPPGTGKTTTIMAMVQSRLELRPVYNPVARKFSLYIIADSI